MAKSPQAIKELKVKRPNRAKPTGEESLRRMQQFKKRKEKFVATVREDKD